MTLMRFDPFRELDRFAEQALSGVRSQRTMPMEAFRRGDEFVVGIDLPGVDPDDVDVTVERNVVSIRTVRRPLHQEGDEVLVDERPQGEFSRQLFLGDNLDSGGLSAQFEHGALILTIPVLEESKPRKIDLKSGGERRWLGSGKKQSTKS
ncbi:MAG: Hsp20/alpha crystallin family protein [Pseudonocardia sp.]|nr:Hsp20/alpha crystallin family protein [Pseudonocardia sp.]